MLNAYVQRADGEVLPVRWQHTGQHLGVTGGVVRSARLFWEQAEIKQDDHEAARDMLLSSVALIDTLVLTRKSGASESVVFRGLFTETNADGVFISVVATDDPAAQRLFEQPFTAAALNPSDQPPPAPAQPPGEQQAAMDAAGLQALDGLGGGVRVRSLGSTSPDYPAGRAGGLPAGFVPSVPSSQSA